MESIETVGTGPAIWCALGLNLGPTPLPEGVVHLPVIDPLYNAGTPSSIGPLPLPPTPQGQFVSYRDSLLLEA